MLLLFDLRKMCENVSAKVNGVLRQNECGCRTFRVESSLLHEKSNKENGKNTIAHVIDSLAPLKTTQNMPVPRGATTPAVGW